MELKKILHSKGFEQEDYISQIRSLDFWQSGDEHLVFVLPLSVEPETLAWTRTASTTRSLICIGLALKLKKMRKIFSTS